MHPESPWPLSATVTRRSSSSELLEQFVDAVVVPCNTGTLELYQLFLSFNKDGPSTPWMHTWDGNGCKKIWTLNVLFPSLCFHHNKETVYAGLHSQGITKNHMAYLVWMRLVLPIRSSLLRSVF